MIGKLIVFEGTDKSSKTTQSIKLCHRLNDEGYKSVIYTFPDRQTPIGKVIDKVLEGKLELNKQSLHLLFSANRWEFYDVINTHLNNGINVILDRYLYSGLVYSISNGLDLEWCKHSDIGLKIPDIIFFLNIDDNTLKSRLKTSDKLEIYETYQFQRNVRKLFTDILSSYSNITNIIDANGNIDDIHENIYNILETCL